MQMAVSVNLVVFIIYQLCNIMAIITVLIWLVYRFVSHCSV